MQNLNREQIIKELEIPSETLWAINNYWTPKLNQKLFNWIANEFIPKHDIYVFKLCRNQILVLWSAFQDWLKNSKQIFDLCKLDVKIVENFCNFLPEIYWSRASIQLLEITLIEVRKFLYLKTLISGDVLWGRNLFIEDYIFTISLWDYQTIRKHFIKENNDFEIVFFELFTIGLKKIDLKGKNIIFKDERAYIIFRKKLLLTCPIIVSRNLLKLLRSKNILANDKVFSTFINDDKLKKKILKICTDMNIPLFATDMIHGYLKKFIKKIEINADKHQSTTDLNYLDKSYQKLIEKTENNFKPYHIKPLFDVYWKLPENSKRIGYAWSKEGENQFIDNQIEALKKAKCKQLVIEITESEQAPRPKLEKIFDTLNSGDTLVVCKMISLGLTFEEAIIKVGEFLEQNIAIESIYDCFGVNMLDNDNIVFSCSTSIIFLDHKSKKNKKMTNRKIDTLRQSK